MRPNGARDELHPARSRGASGAPGRARGERSDVASHASDVSSIEWLLHGRDGASARSRFTFLIVLPDRGVIEITDPLHRTVSRLVFDGKTAYLVLPGKRAYWQADRSEIMTKLLGLDISPAELAALLSGREQSLSGWSLEADDRGRIVGGHRSGLEFLVRDFFNGGRLPRTIDFSNGTDQGSLRVSRLQFNQPPREGALSLSFLDDDRYRAVGWTEIEAWLRDED